MTALPASIVMIPVWDLEGGPMGWKSPEYNVFHPVDPYLFELGWRA